MERGGKRISTEINGKPQMVSEWSSAASSKLFMSVVSDDLLLEIFLRLSDFRSTIRSRAVCKRWLSLLSQRQFVCDLSRRHKGRIQFPQLLSKFLFKSPLFPGKKFYELSLENRNDDIDGKAETCLQFLPWPAGHTMQSGVLALLEDLLVLRRNPRHYYIYNWLTRQLFALPQPPREIDGKWALVFDSNGCWNNKSSQCNCPTIRFRIVVIYSTLRSILMASIYCSETRQWIESREVSFPFDIVYRHLLPRQAVVSNGVAYWLVTESLSSTVTGIAALDPFKGGDHPQRWRLINMPIGFGRGWRSLLAYVCLGLVQGRLRIAQLFFRTNASGSAFALKVWQLIFSENDDSESMSWRLVHDVKVDNIKIGNWRKLHVIAFHPENGDVIFLLHGFDIYQYEVGSRKCEKVSEFPHRDDKYNDMKTELPKFLDVYPLAHPCLGPTQISELPLI